MLPGDSFGLVIAFAIGYDEVGVGERSPLLAWSNASSSKLQEESGFICVFGGRDPPSNKKTKNNLPSNLSRVGCG